MPADYDRIRDPELAEHYVYRLRGKRGGLLYIDCSMVPESRITHHTRRGDIGHLIFGWTLEGPYNYQTARRIEREAIQAERPRFNVEWTPNHKRGRRMGAR